MGVIEQLTLDRPAFHGNGTVRWDCLPETLAAIERSVTAGARTLEIGCGASTVVFIAGGAHHTVVSPDADEHRRVVRYCEQRGIDTSRATFYAGYSDAILPQICTERVLDVAFIDGAHSFPYPEVDWHYISKAMKVGGVLMMDDVPIPAVAPLYRLMSMEPHWVPAGIFDGRAAAFTLVAVPPVEDWGQQRFNRSYPDYSFLPPREWLSSAVTYRAGRLKSHAGRLLTLSHLRRGPQDPDQVTDTDEA